MNTDLMNNYVSILKCELIPALGCTEPIAIAYAAAKAKQVLGEEPTRIEMWCSGNIIKNVKGVIVPNSNGLKGIEAAALLGLIGGNADKELEVLSNVTESDIEKTKEMIGSGFCRCHHAVDVNLLYILAKVYSDEHTAEVEIQNAHTFITVIRKDGETLFTQEVASTVKDCKDKGDRSKLNIKDIIAFADKVPMNEIEEIFSQQINLNVAISNEGLQNSYGADVGKTLLKCYGNDIHTRAKAVAAAGSDARMGGCPLPVVINSGSGNQGLTASLPVIEYAKELNVSKEKLFRALAVSNLIAIYQKYYIGSLSAYCGAVSAACGSGAGIAYLHGANLEEISNTITNTLANVGGIACDGAKPSCAAKIASSVDAAIMGFKMSQEGNVFHWGEGIVQKTADETVKCIGHIGKDGMKYTDETILNIMLQQ